MGNDYMFEDENEQYRQQAYYYQQPPKKADNGLAIASLVLGIIALLLFLSFFNILLALVSIVLGGIYLSQAKGQKGSQGLAIAGIITSVLSVVLCGACYGFIIANIANIYDASEDLIQYYEEYDEDYFDNYLDDNQLLEDELHSLDNDDTL